MDKFVAMVSAKGNVDLRLSDFEPQTQLKVKATEVRQPSFPVVDSHNHLDSLLPQDVLAVMDACGVEQVVNITMKTGEEALEMISRFRNAASRRFHTIGWMDWSDVAEDSFIARSLERISRLVDYGAVGIKFWKDLGISVTKRDGSLLRIDDESLAPLFDKAGELGIPVMFHTADPDAFFAPMNGHNERYEELAAHPDWAYSVVEYSKPSLLEQRNRVIERHPKTVFIGAHLAESGEDLAALAKLLDRLPNLLVDISARTPELGRQPFTAREFLIRYADRVLFGTDLLPEVEMYRLYYRFLESADEYFDYPSHASRQGRWKVYGLNLPCDVLEKLYSRNARALFGR
jgi:predicted TIM-barrel fold metal-dependent hydrolase